MLHDVIDAGDYQLPLLLIEATQRKLHFQFAGDHIEIGTGMNAGNADGGTVKWIDVACNDGL